jgi:hypothetical protein
LTHADDADRAGTPEPAVSAQAQGHNPPEGLSEAGEEPTSSPRAHCVAAGLLFQSIGSILLFGSCCLWSMSGLIEPKVDEPPGQWLGLLWGEHRTTALLTLNMITSFVGGMALLAAGVGLTGEKRLSGRLAMVIAGLMTLLYVGSAIAFAVLDGRWGAMILAGVLGVVCGGLFLAAAHCAAILKRHPPPADQNVVTDEFLERYRREREERRRKFNA